MKKFILIVIALLFSTSLVFGGFVEIGNGTEVTTGVPCTGYRNYSWSQLIYLQSEIGMARDITGLRYNVSCSSSAYEMVNQKIFMGHTPEDVFEDATLIDTTGLTKVFDGSVTWGGTGWQGIDFTTPFSYNNVDNLIIVWINYDGSGASDPPQFYYTSQPDRCVYQYNDSTMPIPGANGRLKDMVVNIRMVVDIPYFSYITNLTGDAYVPIGKTINYCLQISNAGNNDDSYDLSLSGGDWTYIIRDKDDTQDITTVSIDSGETDTVLVKVTPLVSKDISDSTTFNATSQGDPTIINGIGIKTIAYEPYSELFEDFETCVEPELPAKWAKIVQSTDYRAYLESYDKSSYAYSGSMSIKMHNYSDTSGELLLITPALKSCDYGNIVSAMIRSSSSSIQHILVGTMTDPRDPSTFSQVESFEVTRTYSEISCQIDFNDSTGYVAFKHGGDGTNRQFYIDDVSCENVVPTPDMVIDETSHDFGIVDQGTVATWDVTIYNNGYGTLYINDATVNAPFSVVYPDSIEPISSGVATITLDAATKGMFDDILEFHTNATQDSTIDLRVIVQDNNYLMQGFEETTFPPPLGWENPDGYWARFTGEAYKGEGYARCGWGHEYDAVLVSPKLIISGSDFIDFYWRNADLYDTKGTKVIGGDTLFVEVSNTYLDPNPVWECIAILSSNAPMDEYEEVFVEIPDIYIGNNAKIRWRHRSKVNTESRGVGLDNIIMPATYIQTNFSVNPEYISDHACSGGSTEYTYEVKNLGIRDDRFIITVQDSTNLAWTATTNVPYLDLASGASGSFELTVEIPETAELEESQLTTLLVYSRENNAVSHEVGAYALCHPKDPYESNDVMAEATEVYYGFVSDGAQIYYDPNYRDKDIDIYSIDCLESDIVSCSFEVPYEEIQFNGAIKLVNADSTELDYANSSWGGHQESESLQYRIPANGRYYWMLGESSSILEGKHTNKGDGINDGTRTYYTVTFEQISSPEIDVSPTSLRFGSVSGSGGTVEEELFISNVASDTSAADLSWDIELQVPELDTLYESGFDDFDDWSTLGGIAWSLNNNNFAGGTSPEACFECDYSVGLQRLISPVIATSGNTSAYLTFKHYVDDYGGSSDYTIGVATTSDNGGTWNTIWSTSPISDMEPETVSVPIENGDVGSDQFQICWYFTGDSYDIDNWYVDDVVLCVGQWIYVSPVSGVIKRHNTRTVTVTCDDIDLNQGTYTADLIVHNDASLYGSSDIIIPVTFNITDESGELQGTVTHENNPVSDVMISVGGNITYTDDNGNYSFNNLPSGYYDVYFYKEGYEPYWAYDVYLNPDQIVTIDAELTLDFPQPENLSATGISEAIELVWDKPQNNGTQAKYIIDDGTFEKGWALLLEGWIGTLFETLDEGELVSFDIFGLDNSLAGTGTVTIDVYDSDRKYVGSSVPFIIPADDWITVSAPNIPFTDNFYAMIHWDGFSGHTNYIGLDRNGTSTNINRDWYFDGSHWQNFHEAVGIGSCTCGIRATAVVQGKGADLAYKTYKRGEEPEVYYKRSDNLTSETVSIDVNNMLFKNGPTIDSGNYELSHYIFNSDDGTTTSKDYTLLGYNVYEESKGFISYIEGEDSTFFVDDIVAVGEEYTYWVTGIYEQGESESSNTDSAIPLGSDVIYHETFNEDWSTTGWNESPLDGNWNWCSGRAYLYGYPAIQNYDMSLISPEIELPDDSSKIDDLRIKMFIDDGSLNYSSNEMMEIWIVHDAEETKIFEFESDYLDWGVVGGTDFVYSDMSQYAGQTIQIDFRSRGGSTSYFNSWSIYDVLLEGTSQYPPNYGALEGTVTDYDGNALADITVTAGSSDYNAVYTDENGYYLINPLEVGTYDVGFYKDGYNMCYDDVEIDSGTTTVLNVILDISTMNISPSSIDACVSFGDIDSTVLTITNNGSTSLDWSLYIEKGDKQRVSIPAVTDDFPCKTDKFSVERAPLGLFQSMSGTSKPEPEFILMKGSIGYGFQAYSSYYEFVELDTDVPDELNHLFSVDFLACAGDFGADDDTYMYISDSNLNFLRVDMESGDVTQIGVSSGLPENLWDMACDKTTGTMYGTSNNTIYTIDITTGECTEVGPIGNYGAMIAIAIDGNGDMWGHDIGTDDIWHIDKETGSGTYVGATGLNANYSQSMAWDPITDIVYLAAYNYDNSSYELRVVDLITGATEVVGDGVYQKELTVLAFNGNTQWMAVNPTSGTVDPNGNQEVTVCLNALDDPVGTIHTCNLLFETDGGTSVSVPATLMVGNPKYGNLRGVVTETVSGMPIEGALITANSTSVDSITYTGYTNSDGEYEILNLVVGYYTVNCAAEGYTEQSISDVSIQTDQTAIQNFALTGPTMDIEPLSINTTVAVGEISSTTITVTNNGDGILHWSAAIEEGDKDLVAKEKGSFGYGLYKDIELSYYIGFYMDVDIPDELNGLFSDLFESVAGDFGVDDNHMYFYDSVSDNLICVDMEAGSVTTIGPCSLNELFYLSDMAFDRTTGIMYGVDGNDGDDQQIYTIDLTTGECTAIGYIGNDGYGIQTIAIDGNGDMWALDVSSDKIWHIDKETGAGTPVSGAGEIGYDASNSQGMAWDPITDIVFLAAFNYDNLSYELRTVDLATGTTELLGDGIYYQEVVVLGFPGVWAFSNPRYGEITSGGASQDVTLYFSAGSDPEGTVHAGNILFESDEGLSVTIPVTLTVVAPGYGSITGVVTEAATQDPIEEATITISNDFNTYEVNSNENGYYEVNNVVVGTYDIECEETGYNEQVATDIEIYDGQTTTQNFALTAPIIVVDTTAISVEVEEGTSDTYTFTIRNIGNGPMDYTLQMFNNGKVNTDYSNCSKDTSIIRQDVAVSSSGGSTRNQTDNAKDEIVLQYDNGHQQAVGLTSSGTFIAAARFTSEELYEYYNVCGITGSEIYINDIPSSVTIRIWEGGVLGSEVYTEDITSQITSGWNSVDLTTPIPLLYGNEYWIGYEIIQNDESIYPMGADEGPAVSGKGDWIYYNSTWTTLAVCGMDCNWNIHMVLDNSVHAWLIAEPSAGTIAAGDCMDITLTFDAAELVHGDTKTAELDIVPSPYVGLITIPVVMSVVEVSTGGGEPPLETALYGNFPNPMKGTTTFRFSLKDKSHVELSIYNIKGQLVETLLNEEAEPTASYNVVWDGTSRGKKLANGIYFYRLETDTESFLKKMILMR